MGDQKTLILGVGAQKAGTTWLFSELRHRPGMARGLVKEYHAWDMPAGTTQRPRAETEKHARLEEMRADRAAWFAHFADLLAPDGVRWAMDITPAYAGLGTAEFAAIRDGLRARGIAVRVVFLLRDPLERLWSQARMRHARRSPRVDPATDATPEDVLLQIHDRPGAALRTRYHETLARLETVFAPDEIFVGLFEEIFGAVGAGPLWDFLGMEDPPETGVKVRAGVVHDRPSAAACARVVRHYADVYAATRARFPQVATLWGGFAYLDADSSAVSRD